MRAKDLFEKRIDPGSRRTIPLKLRVYAQKKQEIDRYAEKMRSLDPNIHHPELHQQLEKLSADYQAIIDRMQEEYTHDSPLTRLFNGITKNCTEAVAAMQQTHDFMFRGTSNQTKDAFYGRSHERRLPTHSNSDLSEFFNRMMEMEGFEARRDNSIFVTSDLSLANKFGNVYVIFPRDGFKFTWSTTKSDLVLSTRHWFYFFDEGRVEELLQAVLENYDTRLDHMFEMDNITFDRDPAKIMQPGGFFDFDTWVITFNILKDACEDGILPQEIYEEYLLSPSDLSGPGSPGALRDEYGLEDTDLANAMMSGNEILINGEFYAVSVEYLEEIKRFFKIGG